MNNYKIETGDFNNYLAKINLKNNEKDYTKEIAIKITILKDKKLDKQTQAKITKKEEKNNSDKEYHCKELTYIKEVLKKIANNIND